MSPEISGIAAEIKQTRPFSSQSEETAVALLRTADLVRRAVGVTVGVEGITPQQYNVLRILRGAGERGLPTLEIADRMIETTPGITRLIDRLEEKTLVLRERCKTDRRQVFCSISQPGLAMLDRLDAPVRESDSRALASLTSEELQSLLTLLGRVRTALSPSNPHSSAVGAT